MVTFIKVLAWIFAFGSAFIAASCIFTWYYLNHTKAGELHRLIERCNGRAVSAKSPLPSLIIFAICIAAIIATWGQ